MTDVQISSPSQSSGSRSVRNSLSMTRRELASGSSRVDDGGGEVVDARAGRDEVAAALERREPHADAGDVREREVGERADEDRVALAQRIGRRLVEHVQRGDERPARLAPERARPRAVDDVDHELCVLGGVGGRNAPLLERRAERGDEVGERALRRLSFDCVSHASRA